MLDFSKEKFDPERIRKLGVVLNLIADQLIPAVLDNSDKVNAVEANLRKKVDRAKIPRIKNLNKNTDQKPCTCP